MGAVRGSTKRFQESPPFPSNIGVFCFVFSIFFFSSFLCVFYFFSLFPLFLLNFKFPSSFSRFFCFVF